VPFLQNHTVGANKFAIKSIPKNKIQSMNKTMQRELSILKHADHPNIINLSEVYEDELSIHLVMEYCNGGDLYEHLL